MSRNNDESIRRIEDLTRRLESCRDENNVGDGLTLDERLRKNLTREEYDLILKEF